ncbi:hypothetical protein HOK51_10040 [Candidatus Woesearchaeota archaeon]|jgi:sulfhydrogenase subunit delta|nr:hypothetical protein [Candidatus Woesearchaeota archaeon]MBT6520164.1 hypothetical protein [Candidatus Woesearchaeota archaeon]MBT7366769.1 hypothetical protein [Candidatus Woesearchaeota archaeon]
MVAKTKSKKTSSKKRKPSVGFFAFTGCEGCQFTVLFIDEILDLLNKVNVNYFHLIKEKNRNIKFDLAFIEGAITSKREIKKLKAIRDKSKFVVALGACACHGGIPAMRNFLKDEELGKYVYTQHMLKDSIEATGIDQYITVDYHMRGCPISKDEFIDFFQNFLKGKIIEQFKGPVCLQCPKRGKDCYLAKKEVCLGAMAHGGCNAICIQKNIPCVLCRGPTKSSNFAAEVNLFKSWGLDDDEIKTKLTKFKNLDLGTKQNVKQQTPKKKK